ncbi:MAG: class I SAM-dependent methyltransferase [Xenococcaceae cyanobacterium]
MPTSNLVSLEPYLTSNFSLDCLKEGILVDQIFSPTPAIEANSYYFGHPIWGKNYLEACHRDDAFKCRWQAATGSWDNKIVVDIGCGPGNVYKTVGGVPKLLIGVDVSLGALKMAQELGYTCLLADAQNLPLVSEFADIVVVNATLHHCEDMSQTLLEASRLVRPGGILVTDHDPQLIAWNYKGLALLLWKARLLVYRILKRGYHATEEEQTWALATEIHHKPGDGLTPKFYSKILEPRGFTVRVYPHNHTVGAKVLEGNYGQAAWKYRLAQQLSQIAPNSPEAALSLMCVAKRGV